MFRKAETECSNDQGFGWSIPGQLILGHVDQWFPTWGPPVYAGFYSSLRS